MKRHALPGREFNIQAQFTAHQLSDMLLRQLQLFSHHLQTRFQDHFVGHFFDAFLAFREREAIASFRVFNLSSPSHDVILDKLLIV